MIDLTPIEIRKKKGDFPRSMRGYSVPDVDLFLDLIADRLEELINRSRELEERVGQLETRVQEYQQREGALNDALLSAQELREDVRRQAAKDAELVLREAELEAERIRAAALGAREQEEDAIRRLRARRIQLLRTFRSFLERELAEVTSRAEGSESKEMIAAGSATPRRAGESGAQPRVREQAPGTGGE